MARKFIPGYGIQGMPDQTEPDDYTGAVPTPTPGPVPGSTQSMGGAPGGSAYGPAYVGDMEDLGNGIYRKKIGPTYYQVAPVYGGYGNDQVVGYKLGSALPDTAKPTYSEPQVWTDPATNIRYAISPSTGNPEKLATASASSGPVGITRDEQTGRRYIMNPNTGGFEWIDPAPAQPAQGRDLRMSDYESANIGLERERLGLSQEQLGESARHNQATEDYSLEALAQQAQQAADDLAFKQDQLSQSYAKMKQDYDLQIAQMQQQQQQWGSISPYQQSQIDSQRGQLDEMRREFDATLAQKKEAEQRAYELQKRAQQEKEYYDYSNTFGYAPPGSSAPGYGPVAGQNAWKWAGG